jgi:hypothetical protein
MKDMSVELGVERVVRCVMLSRSPRRQCWRLIVDEQVMVLDRWWPVYSRLRKRVDGGVLLSRNIRKPVVPAIACQSCSCVVC